MAGSGQGWELRGPRQRAVSIRCRSLPPNGTRPNLPELGFEGDVRGSNVRVVQKLSCPAICGGLW